MKIQELSPGYYKIQRKDAYGSKRRTHNFFGPFYLMRVEMVGRSLKCFIDDNIDGFDPRDAVDYLASHDIVEKLPGAPEVHNPKITISFDDGKGAGFEWKVRSAWALRALFERMPWLQKPFGFLRNRSREH